ncbi:MAG: helix-turn-helix transcriptional regulator, partial [Bacillota bacterium]|nr:helix-turn-helix transcriptional regulator [Bacillota bacterium]
MDPIKTGQLISTTRKELGLTQRDLAEKLRVSEQAVSKWERGRSFPDISILVPLSKELNVSVYDLLEGGRVMDKMDKMNSIKGDASESPNKGIHQAELELDGTIEY